VQFPPSFHAEPATLEYLDWLLGTMRGYSLAVELRHRSWSDAHTETQACLDAHRAAWVLIDEPKFKDSIKQDFENVERGTRNEERGTGNEGLLYVRLHGRNAGAWWDHAESEDRYDYLYTAEELKPIAKTARAASASNRRVRMYMNNHFSAKAAANAAILKHQLDQPVPGEYPREMVDRYPELAGIVTTSGLPL